MFICTMCTQPVWDSQGELDNEQSLHRATCKIKTFNMKKSTVFLKLEVYNAHYYSNLALYFAGLFFLTIFFEGIVMYSPILYFLL